MLPLARRNLFHDKVRLSVTLTGIVFAVVLMVVELGLFAGFSTTTTGLIDHCRADLWVMSKHVPYVELGVPFRERRVYQVRAVSGVLSAENLVNRWAGWKRPDGRRESVQIVGIDWRSSLFGPWNLVPGTQQDDLATPHGVIVDELYKQKLGVEQVGDLVEISGRRARVVGFTHGIRAFTTMPYVFTTLKRARLYANVAVDQTTYGLVKVAPGHDVQQVRQDILRRVPGVDVVTTSEFARMTRNYWLYTTGAGAGVLIAALLGMLVGFVVVTQTIYATTMDHLKELGTLKAMGAPNRYVYKLIVQQAAISAVLGYVLGMGVSFFVVRGGQRSGAAILVTWELVALMFVLTVAMCVCAALVSIRKVTRLDPMMVFKG